MKMSRLVKLFVAVGFAFAATSVAAADFTRPVRIIVPFAPGGTSDILARLIAPKLSTAIGQPVVVENKPGAGGNIGADAVAKSPKDGHTLLLMDVGSLATAPSLVSGLTYDVEKDLAPITMVMFGPYVLATTPSLGVKTPAELVAFSKANPGKLTMANSGVGAVNHLTAIMLGKGTGMTFKHIPYKGGAAASKAVVAGESNVIINGTTATLPFVTSGQMTGIAVTGAARLKAAPNLPTFRELGWPADENGTWQGLLTSGGTPPALVDRLNAEVRKILAEPEIAQKIGEQGGEVKAGTPAEFRTWLTKNIASFGTEIKAAGIKAE